MNRIAMIDWLINSNNANMDIIEATNFVTHMTNVLRIKRVEERDGKYVLSFSDYNDICEVYFQLFKRELSEEKWEEDFMNEFTICEDEMFTKFSEGEINHEELLNILLKNLINIKSNHKED